jgi:toxoflavin biosynthesis protein ToxD
MARAAAGRTMTSVTKVEPPTRRPSEQTVHQAVSTELTAAALVPLSMRGSPDAGLDRGDLAARVEDPALPLASRLAAGAMLALLGDPRIGEIPATCFVPPAGDAPGYWLATYPVTNWEYWRLLSHTGYSGRPGSWYLGAYPWPRANHPVAGLRAQDARAYAAWLSERTGHPWRLPTEAEWEYAAQGPDGLEYPWGEEFDPDAANTRETGLHTTSPVGAFPAGRSPFGVSDMAGNVNEYVADWHAGHPITRGGSFCHYSDLARTRRRYESAPGSRYSAGFRLATSQQPPAGPAGGPPESSPPRDPERR